MVTHFSLDDIAPQAIQGLINSSEFQRNLSPNGVALVQIYFADAKHTALSSVISLIRELLPKAVIVGASTVGEIVNGCSKTGQTVIGFTLFEHSQLTVFSAEMTQNEFQVGRSLALDIAAATPNTKGLLVLSTPLNSDASQLMYGIESASPNYQIFGGGAGDYASMDQSFVFHQDDFYSNGVVAVAMAGELLNIDSHTYLGWKSLSKAMQITATDGLVIKTIDGAPAFDIYKKYLNLANDEQFFLNALEFPFLLERNGCQLARVPVGVTTDGGLIFVADVFEGETVKLGYGDPKLIIDGAKQTLARVDEFEPSAIFLYSCGCRRFLMQEDVDLETQPLQQLAPTFGFYTYGEFFSHDRKLQLLNSTLVTVSLREGAKSNSTSRQRQAAANIALQDPYAHKHTRIVSRLVQFISTTTAELEQASLAKNQFLANTSHELRTPLTSISGYAEAILNGDIGQRDQTRAVEIIHQQAEHLRLLIDDILDISKIEADKLTVTKRDFDLLQLALSIEASFEQQAINKGIEFVVEMSKNTPRQIHADPERLHQILMNLCGNAFKFTQRGQVALKIKTSADNSQLIMAVSDTGIGIPANQITSIFLPFQQTSSSPAAIKGTGLGLTISQQLATLLSGQIEVSSEVDKGSTFTLTLPLIPAKRMVKAMPTTTKQQTEEPMQGRILLAEDCVENGQLFKLLLANAGFEVNLVENGLAAVELALTEDFDLILLDIQMPVMTGLEAIEIIRHSTVDCPIIALTANAMADEVSQYEQLGFSDCLAKPVSKDNLLQCVSAHISRHQTAVPAGICESDLSRLRQQASVTIAAEIAHLPKLLEQQLHTDIAQAIHKIKGLAAQFDFDEVRALCIEYETSISAAAKQECISHLWQLSQNGGNTQK